MKVLVTGGTGFVGAWTAKAVQDAGHDVRFLVRSPARLATSAERIGADISDHVVGDIADAEATTEALAGCDAVIHCAAMVSTDPSRADEMLHTNLEGARNVLGGAVAAKLDPIVHVSSFSALFRPGLDVLHADLPVVGGSDGYGKSKAVVEAYARGLQDAGAPVNITYPGMVLGPPAGDQFGEAAEGVEAAAKMHGVPGRSAAWIVVDVRDLAAIHVALLEPGRGPRRYMAGGQRVTVGSRHDRRRRRPPAGGHPGPGCRAARTGIGVRHHRRPLALRDTDQFRGDAVLHPDASLGRHAQRAGTRCHATGSAGDVGRYR